MKGCLWKFIGIIFLIAIVMVILGKFVSAISMVAVEIYEKVGATNLIAIFVIFLLLFAIDAFWNYDDSLSRYHEVSLISFLPIMTDNEKSLFLFTCKMLKDGVSTFKKHTIGEYGFTTTDHYFDCLKNKALFDSVKKGEYAIDYIVFFRALEEYNKKINNYQKKARLSIVHKKEARKTIEKYNYDKANIRITPNIILSGQERLIREAYEKKIENESNKTKKKEPKEPRKVVKYCENCGGQIVGIKGEIGECAFCGTKQNM